MAFIGNPVGNAIGFGQQLLAPAQYGPVTGPGFLDPWGAAYNAGVAPIPSPIQVVTGIGNSLGLPTLPNPFGGGFPTAMGLPFVGGAGGGGAAAALAGAGVAGLAGAGAAAALLGPVAGMSPGVLILLLIVAAVILYPLFKTLFVAGTTSGSAASTSGLLLLLLFGGLIFAMSGSGNSGGQDWTFALVLLLVVFAVFALGSTSLSTLLGLGA